MDVSTQVSTSKAKRFIVTAKAICTYVNKKKKMTPSPEKKVAKPYPGNQNLILFKSSLLEKVLHCIFGFNFTDQIFQLNSHQSIIAHTQTCRELMKCHSGVKIKVLKY